MSHDVVDVKKHVRVYLIVFAALLVLTAFTVGVAYLHLKPLQAVLVALFIASIKGTLVAGYFMHLISEKKVIYGILIVTALFFAVLLAVTYATEANMFHITCLSKPSIFFS